MQRIPTFKCIRASPHRHETHPGNGFIASYPNATINFTPCVRSTVAGAVVPIYTLPGVGTQLVLTTVLVAQIFRSAITSWNDTAIAALNPSITLPNEPIRLCVRADKSGTTEIFKKALANAEAAFATQIGTSSAASWPGASVEMRDTNTGVAQSRHRLHRAAPCRALHPEHPAPSAAAHSCVGNARRVQASPLSSPRRPTRWATPCWRRLWHYSYQPPRCRRPSEPRRPRPSAALGVWDLPTDETGRKCWDGVEHS